jgi:hypothetical protein
LKEIFVETLQELGEILTNFVLLQRSINLLHLVRKLVVPMHHWEHWLLIVFVIVSLSMKQKASTVVLAAEMYTVSVIVIISSKLCQHHAQLDSVLALQLLMILSSLLYRISIWY